MVFLMLLAACDAGEEGSAEPGLSGGARTFADTGEADEPALSGEEAGAALARFFAAAPPTSGSMALSYEALMTHRTLSCPAAEHPTLDPWVVWAAEGAPCTTESGWTWFGLANGMGSCEEVDGQQRVNVGALVSFRATDPDGNDFVAGGTFEQGCTFSDAEGACTGSLTGGFSYPAASGWLKQGAEAALYFTDRWEDARHELTYDGGIALGADSVVFHELTVTPEEAHGRIGLRDATGYWHEITLEEGSGGCGTLVWRGRAEGELCLDLGEWNAPLAQPEAVCSASP